MGAVWDDSTTGSGDVVRHQVFGTSLTVHECLGALSLLDRHDAGCRARGAAGRCHETGLVATVGSGAVRAVVWDDEVVRHVLLWCEAVNMGTATRLLDRLVLAVMEAELRTAAGLVTLPADVDQIMEAYGRQEFEWRSRRCTRSSPASSHPPVPLVVSPLSDPDDLVRALADACLPAGGWAAYGAVQCVVALAGPERHGEAWFRLLDAAIEHLHAARVPWWLVPPHLAARFEAGGGIAEEWLPWQPPPEPNEMAVTRLGADEARLVVAMDTPLGPTRVLVRRRGPDFRADFEDGAVDPDTGAITWASVGHVTMETLFELFVEVAWKTSGWLGAWVHDELRPFLPRPSEPI